MNEDTDIKETPLLGFALMVAGTLISAGAGVFGLLVLLAPWGSEWQATWAMLLRTGVIVLSAAATLFGLKTFLRGAAILVRPTWGTLLDVRDAVTAAFGRTCGKTRLGRLILRDLPPHLAIIGFRDLYCLNPESLCRVMKLMDARDVMSLMLVHPDAWVLFEKLVSSGLCSQEVYLGLQAGCTSWPRSWDGYLDARNMATMILRGLTSLGKCPELIEDKPC